MYVQSNPNLDANLLSSLELQSVAASVLQLYLAQVPNVYHADAVVLVT
jgi:hypothetical protein